MNTNFIQSTRQRNAHRKVSKILTLAVIAVITLGLITAALISAPRQSAQASTAGIGEEFFNARFATSQWLVTEVEYSGFRTAWRSGPALMLFRGKPISAGGNLDIISSRQVVSYLDGNPWDNHPDTADNVTYHANALSVIRLPNNPNVPVNMTVNWLGQSTVTQGNVARWYTGNLTAGYYTVVLAIVRETMMGNIWVESFFGYTNFVPAVLPPDPEMAGFTFMGWYFDSDFTQPFDGRPIFNDTTLFARFEIIVYNITFNLGGGINHPANPATFTIQSDTIVLQDPTREGYIFAGWTDGGTVPAGSIGDRIFTANWTRIILTVTFIVNGEIHSTVLVPWGETMLNSPQIMAALGELIGAGYMPRNLNAMLAAYITEDMSFEIRERRAMTRAIRFAAWSIQWWWVYVVSIILILGGIGFVIAKKVKSS